MLQSEFEDISDIFGVEGLERLANLELPHKDSVMLAMFLNELELYAEQHDQLEREINIAASNDEDCKLLMTIPGIGPFVAVTIKARIRRHNKVRGQEKACIICWGCTEGEQFRRLCVISQPGR